MLLIEGLTNILHGVFLLLIANYHWMWVWPGKFRKSKPPIRIYMITNKSYVQVKDGKASLEFVKKRSFTR